MEEIKHSSPFLGVQLMTARPKLNVEDKLVVIILPDSLRNYLTKFASDDWMLEQGYDII